MPSWLYSPNQHQLGFHIIPLLIKITRYINKNLNTHFFRKIGRTNPIQRTLSHKRRSNVYTHKMWEEIHLPWDNFKSSWKKKREKLLLCCLHTQVTRRWGGYRIQLAPLHYTGTVSFIIGLIMFLFYFILSLAHFSYY